MPAYAYEALDAQGDSRKGLLDADSARSARAQLRAQSLVPLSVTPVSTAAAQTGLLSRQLFAPRALPAADLAIWTRQLAGLVGAGLPLERALSSLAEEADTELQRHLNAALRAEVNGGASFASALAQHPREFSSIYTAVIEAGEHSGHLDLVLDRLADDLEDRQALQAKLIGAALYPAIVSLLALVIVLFLVSYVVPQVAQVFTGTQRSLPWLTVAMLAIGGFLKSWGWLLLLGLVAGLTLFLALLRRPALRLRFDAFWLTLPWIGRLARGYNAARFASTLSMLSAAGVPILKALQATAGTLSNQALRSDAQAALVMVREGAPLGVALAQQKRLPGLLAMFARLGEQTGQLPLMLQRAATQLGNEVQRRAMQLATVLEPLLIVAMGLVVMLIVLAVLLPIIQLNQWVR
ncbi:MAG: type II secretion system inner membrane protein GspF [Hylemonella sp.]|nr:type II secretion system inner membrane protein GspF [Hylemonella sp.]